MRRRKWLFGLLLLLLGVVIVWSLRSGVWRHHCYDRIQLGNPAAEAVGLLTEQGYTRTGCIGQEVYTFMVFDRGQLDPTIYLQLNSDGCVTDKDYASVLENSYYYLRDLLRRCVRRA